MTITFVSDIHLNFRKNREFERKRFLELVEFLKEQNTDWLVLGGDIFDFPQPNLEELFAFYDAIDQLKNHFDRIIVYHGNHESLSKTEYTFDFIPKIDFELLDNDYLTYKNYNLFFVGHKHIKKIFDISPRSGYNILFSHIRANLGVVKAELNLSKVSKMFDYVILGDIHIPYEPYHNVMYCGSPYTIQYELQRATGIFKISLKRNMIWINFL